MCVSQFSTSSWNHFLCELNREESADKGTILGEPSPTAKSYFLVSRRLAPPPPVWEWLVERELQRPWCPRAEIQGAQNRTGALLIDDRIWAELLFERPLRCKSLPSLTPGK